MTAERSRPSCATTSAPRGVSQTLLVVGEKDRTVVGKARLPPRLRAVAGNYPELGRKV